MCEFDLKMVLPLSIESGSVGTAGTAAAVRTRLFNYTVVILARWKWQHTE